MFGRRNPGQAAQLLPALLAIPILAGCFPEDSDRKRQAEEAVSPPPLPTTAEQVNRGRKSDRLALGVQAPPAIPKTGAKPDRAAGLSPRAGSGQYRRGPLSQFYAALDDLTTGARRKPVTILHLGDSHIASDRVTGDLRDLLQSRFGDSGRGLMMPGFPFPYYRARGVRFSKSNGWKAASSLRRAPAPYGLTGVRLTSRSKGAWLRLDSIDGPFEWAEVTFLVGPKQGSAELQVGRARKSVVTRASRQGSKTVRVQYKGSRLTVRTTGKAGVTVLSWAVGHERPGVRYVNLGIPSATADITRHWDDDLIAADLQRLDPDLVVLGYGTNEGFNDGLDVAAYETRVAELLRRLQDRAPTASYLVIGPADSARFPRFARKGRKYTVLRKSHCRELSSDEKRRYRSLVKSRSGRLARWHAPPKLAAVREALERVAARAMVDYWDWSKLMGGPCGIHDWATAKPALAASDHVHITAEGSRRTAQALYDRLMAGFEAHRKVASR